MDRIEVKSLDERVVLELLVDDVIAGVADRFPLPTSETSDWQEFAQPRRVTNPIGQPRRPRSPGRRHRSQLATIFSRRQQGLGE